MIFDQPHSTCNSLTQQKSSNAFRRLFLGPAESGSSTNISGNPFVGAKRSSPKVKMEIIPSNRHFTS